jgi:hypothetical protein
MGQAHALVSLFIGLFPFIGGVILAIVIGGAAVNPIGSAMLAIVLYASGFAFFLTAKVSVIRSGHLVTFGSRSMRPRYRALYRIGYVLMVAGLMFTVGLLATRTV